MKKSTSSFPSIFRLTMILFLSLSTAALLLASELPSPEEFFGFRVGADYHLLNYEQAVEYWKKLESLSGRIKLMDYGKSSQGRPMLLVVISSEDTIVRLDHYRNISKRLSYVRGVPEDEAQKLAAEGKAIVWIDGGLHADEVAPAQHIIQLTYDLVADSSLQTQKIRDEVIAMLVLPNPDGMDMVADWYKKNLGTPYETSSLVQLYQEYIGHDNNRDSFMLSVPETRNINTVVHQEWYPHIFYNHHQRAPFPSLIFVPPDSEPTNPNLHPLLLRWQNFIGAAIAKAFESEGKQGVISRYLFDTWYPGYVTQVCDFHNVISTFSETFLYHYATPHFYTVEDFPAGHKDFAISLFFTNPWEGGWWRLRNAVEYCLTASKSVLDIAAKHRAELLYAKYAMGRETIERYKKEPPFGWIVPWAQRDEGATRRLINLLLDLEIEVYEAELDFSADGRAYPKGTCVLPTSQPFGRLLKTLFEVQVYPDLRKYPFLWQSIVEPVELKVPPLQTYDVLGWTLPLQMGVEAVPLYSAAPIQMPMKRVAAMLPARGRISGTGNFGYLIPYENIDSVTAVNELLNAGAQVEWTKTSITEEGKTFGPGTVIVPASSTLAEKTKILAEKYGIDVIRLLDKPSAQAHKLRVPRIALYQPWTENIDEGWTRLVLNNHGFRYTTLHNSEIRAGNLGDRFDAIILPDETPEAIVNGQPLGSVPPEFAGGILASGVRNLKEFVEAGGTLITLGASSDLAIEEFKLPMANVLKPLKPEEFFGSGILVRVNLDPGHPLTYGLPREVTGFFAQSPTFQIFPGGDKKNPPRAIGTYPDKDIVLSGWMVGEKYLRNKAAAVEVPYGKGRIILLGFRVQHRGQTVGTFKLLFNALYYSILGSSFD